MKRFIAVLLAAAMLPLSGCAPLSLTGMLPYAREIEDMELVRTLGVDGDGAGVTVTGSGGTQEGEKANLVTGQAATISAAVLTMQSQGSSYLYFGHVGQLLLGEELARVHSPLVGELWQLTRFLIRAVLVVLAVECLWLLWKLA